MPGDVEVVGGAYGASATMVVDCAHIRELAASCEALDASTDHLHHVFVQGRRQVEDIVHRTMLTSPATAVRLMAQGLGADVLIGVRSLLESNVAEALRIAADCYEKTEDSVQTRLNRRIESLSLAGMGLWRVGRAALTGDPHLPTVAVNELTRNSRLTQHAVPGVAALAWGAVNAGNVCARKPVNPSPTIGSVAGEVASHFRERPAVITAVTTHRAAAPTTLRDAAELVDTGGPPGRIDVIRRTVIGPDGTPHETATVILPGTSHWGFVPGTETDLRDLNSNLELAGGKTSAEVEVLPEVLRRAGVPAGASIAIIGHSQGGMAAIRAARHGPLTDKYTVTHVVTAGSPAADPLLPSTTNALHLEQKGDAVPALDGRDAPRTRNRVTVRSATADVDELGERHGMATYSRLAGQADEAAARGAAGGTNGERSVAAFVDGMRAAGHLGGDGRVTVQRFDVGLGPEPPAGAPQSGVGVPR